MFETNNQIRFKCRTYKSIRYSLNDTSSPCNKCKIEGNVMSSINQDPPGE